MLRIPKELFVTRSVHRTLGLDLNNSILSCGFIHHTRHLPQNENLVFKYYGALLLLSGEGTYMDRDGKSTRIYPGCFIQRIPYVRHSTITKEDGKWLEFFVCFGYETYRALTHMGLLLEAQQLVFGIYDMHRKQSLHPSVRSLLYQARDLPTPTSYRSV